jgi:membrane fusion protein (multidrug efflux system)
MVRWPSAIRRGGLLVLLSLVAACSGGDNGPKRPPPQVGFYIAQPSTVPLSVTLGGRTVAYETSEVRPQVNGLIQRRLFTEGAYVRAGQPLYQIDASLYRAAANQATANLQSARATAAAAVVKADRYKPLAQAQAVSQQDYTDTLAQAREAQAAVAQNEAALDTAQINLKHTTVPAPISGRIGRSMKIRDIAAQPARFPPNLPPPRGTPTFCGVFCGTGRTFVPCFTLARPWVMTFSPF